MKDEMDIDLNKDMKIMMIWELIFRMLMWGIKL
jgi:hypothetical protein